jgi:hypothetical protein
MDPTTGQQAGIIDPARPPCSLHDISDLTTVDRPHLTPTSSPFRKIVVVIWIRRRKARPVPEIVVGTTPRRHARGHVPRVARFLCPNGLLSPSPFSLSVRATPRSAGASPRTAAASGNSPPAAPIVTSVLTSRPPVLTRRCWRLVNDQLSMRVGSTSRRQRFPRL